VPEIIGKRVAQASAAAPYASCLLLYIPTWMQKVMFHLKENNTNAIEYTILGSMDGVVWEEVVATADLAKNASVKVTAITDPWPYLDLQIRDNVDGVHGSVTAYCSGW
jgi:hypothetical protein